MKFKIVTWNMAYWSHKPLLEQAWRYFIEEVDADIYLFQEARPPQNLINDPNFLWFEIGGHRPWGTGIYSKKYPLRQLQIQTNYTGSLVLGEVKVSDNLQFTVISLYGLLETVGNTAYAITTLHRMLSDLTGVFNGHMGGKRNIILGGDLNASIQCDIYDGGKAHNLFFQRLEDFKLMDCFSPYFNDFVQTHRHHRSDKPWQNDYLFISDKLAKIIKSCDVLDNEDVRKLSDHNPVLITLEI
jgi:exodeoxyribonuclease-3